MRRRRANNSCQRRVMTTATRPWTLLAPGNLLPTLMTPKICLHPSRVSIWQWRCHIQRPVLTRASQRMTSQQAGKWRYQHMVGPPVLYPSVVAGPRSRSRSPMPKRASWGEWYWDNLLLSNKGHRDYNDTAKKLAMYETKALSLQFRVC